MAVEIVYRSSRDPERLFMQKAEADRHDKMLALAELVSDVLRHAVPSITEIQAEEAGIYMARERDVFSKAFRNNPEILSTLLEQASDTAEP